jgi:predicted dehydrogenase
MDERVAVIGCGYWGKNLVRNFAQIGALAAICDADPSSLRAQSSHYPHIQTVASFDDILADNGIRGVVLATPAALHHAQAKQALLHGKDVFIEKPLALHYSEGLELVELAQQHNAILMVGHVLEYHPAVVLLKDIVHCGELGQIRYVYSNRLNLGKVRQEENILWSFAPHDISVITSLLGQEPVSVSSSGGAYLQTDIADVTVSTMLFNEGVRAHIFVSWLHPYKEQKLVVIGDRKMAVFDDAAAEGKLKIFDKGIEWRAGLPVARQTSESMLFFDAAEPLRMECEHFLSCMRERKTPLTDGVNASRVLKVLEASQMSLEQGGMFVPLTAVRTPTAV